MQWIARTSRTYLLIALIGFVAFVSTLAYLKSLNKTVYIARATSNINSGDIIDNKKIDFIEVPDDQVIRASSITKEDFSEKKFVARVDLSANDLLSRSNTLRSATSDSKQSMSIGLPIDRANGGDIKKGDRIDIWTTGENARLVANSLNVRRVIAPNKRMGISTSQSITIVVGVNAQEAQNLSGIVGSSDIMVVLSTGSQSVSIPENNTTVSGDGEFIPYERSNAQGVSGE